MFIYGLFVLGIFGILVLAVVLAILYYLVKTAVRNGIQEAANINAAQREMELKIAIREGVKEAMQGNANQLSNEQHGNINGTPLQPLPSFDVFTS